jgi:DNA primase
MSPSRSEIDALKDHIDIVQVISRYVELRRSGSSMMGLCPFHEERSPSFSVLHDRRRGGAHRFGAACLSGSRPPIRR